MVLFRVKPLYVFVSIVTGYFLSLYLGESSELVVRSFVHLSYPGEVIRLILLLLPFGFTLILMRKTLSISALPFHFVLLVADALLLTTFLIPLLTVSTQDSLYLSQPGSILRQSHDVLIAGAVTLHCVFMWVLRPKPTDKHGRKHRK